MSSTPPLAAEIETIRAGLVDMASRVLAQIERAVSAWEEADTALAERVVGGDEEIDELCAQLDWRIYETQLLQSPVAGDQRLLHVGLIAAIALERVGDLAVEIARATESAPPSGQVPEVLDLTARMSARSVDALARAVQAIARGDVALAQEALTTAATVREMLDAVVEATARAGDEPETKTWSSTAVLVARHLERVANNARELGGRVAFLIDGEPFRRAPQTSD